MGTDTNLDPPASAKAARVAMLLGPHTIGAMGRVVRHLTIGLLDEPVNLTVVAPEGEDLASLPSPPIDIITYAPPWLGLRLGHLAEELAEQLSGRGVELLHAADESAHELTEKISTHTGWPYLVTAMSLARPNGLTALGPHCRGVLAASDGIAADLRVRGVVDPDRLHVVRPGVHQARQVNCFRRPECSAAILAVGRLDDYAPFAAVLETFAALRQSDADSVFFLMGNGRAERRLRSRAEAMGLMHSLTFVDPPPPNAQTDILKAADLFVYPRSGGQLEIQLLEAMGVGIPAVVGSPCAGDFIIDAETALRYEATNSADLTAKLRLLLSDRAGAARLAQGALRWLHERHSPSRMVREVAEVYRRHALSARTLQIR